VNPPWQSIRARWVVPITGPPLRDGEVVIENGRIAEVRRARHTSATAEVLDLGDAILLPGLVNAHTHLDYTVFRGLLEDLPFFPWIRALVERKQLLSGEDWLASAIMGAAEAVASGVTTIADCSDSGAALAAAALMGLRGIVYQEIFALDPREPLDTLVSRLQDTLANLRRYAGTSRVRIGVSPHAPYTIHPKALQAIGSFAREHSLPLCIHAAESQDEVSLLMRNEGEFARLLRQRGYTWWQSPPSKGTIAYLEECGVLTPKTLLVHGVQISRADFERAARAGAAWVHCPKSNAKLGNGVSPLLWLQRQWNASTLPAVALGSDSVASNNTLDLFEEMRFALLLYRACNRVADAPTAGDLLYLATMGGSAALGLGHETGSLEPGKWADLTAVSLKRFQTQPCYDPVVTLVHSASAGDVLLTMVEGNVVYSRVHGRRSFPTCSLERYRRRFVRFVRKLRTVGAHA